MALIGGTKKPPKTTGGSPMPGMPGTDDDDLNVELTVRKPAPPVEDGDYLMRLDRYKIWPASEKGPAAPTFTFVVVDPAEKKKLDRGEPSNYGTSVDLRYPLDAGWQQDAANKLIAALGYPPSTWPETEDGRLNVGGVFRQIKADLIAPRPADSPTFIASLVTKAGKGANKDRLFTNIKAIKRPATKPAKATAAVAADDDIPF